MAACTCIYRAECLLWSVGQGVEDTWNWGSAWRLAHQTCTKHVATRVCHPRKFSELKALELLLSAFFEPKLATGMRKYTDDGKEGGGAGNRAVKNSLLVNWCLIIQSWKTYTVALYWFFYPHENLYLGLLWLVGSGVVRFLPKVMVSGFGHKKCPCHVLLLVCGTYITGDAILEVRCTCGMMLLTIWRFSEARVFWLVLLCVQ